MHHYYLRRHFTRYYQVIINSVRIRWEAISLSSNAYDQVTEYLYTIILFQAKYTETLGQAWERFKTILRSILGGGIHTSKLKFNIFTMGWTVRIDENLIL
ncbi:hypothetical protein EPI10_028593 [Gossypium australe]|uniref:Uncharacterized protein n=1 Tax=Gossypium australe TaxID=47621 RepID=A0A5B6UWC1_9ROSI|nr:hypothetical protein EPI10_028593 [Gossypium australe]